MTATHTPGPWTIEADADKAGRHPLHDSRHVVSHNGTVCDLRDQPAQAADARLIAAAPDLLAALKRAAEYADLYEAIIEGGTQDAHLSLLREYIAKAITKAEEG